MKYFLLICFCIGLSTAYSQSNDNTNASAIESTPSAAEAELNQQLESLVLDYELIRASGFYNGSKLISNESLTKMKAITEQVMDLKPDSYQSEYLQFKQDGFTDSGLEHLKSAESKTLNKSELLSDFLATAHILKKKDLLETYAVKLKNSGFIPNATLEYNKNILRSISESNAVIITNGWEDTYPLLTLLKQEGKLNVQVVNMEWLYDRNFRSSLANTLGKSPVGFSNPYQWINEMTLNCSLPIYYTPTVPNSELIKLQNGLTPVGLVFKRGALSIGVQSEQNLSAWKKFSKLSISSSNALSKNYIIMLTMLEEQLDANKSEKETLKQVSATKKALIAKHPSLKQ